VVAGAKALRRLKQWPLRRSRHERSRRGAQKN